MTKAAVCSKKKVIQISSTVVNIAPPTEGLFDSYKLLDFKIGCKYGRVLDNWTEYDICGGEGVYLLWSL